MRAVTSLLALSMFVAAAHAASAETTVLHAGEQDAEHGGPGACFAGRWRQEHRTVAQEGALRAASRGSSPLIDGTDACVYRIRIVFEDDSFYDLRDKVDFCETGSYTIED